jgi:pyruvate formate lyase activating enzyme
MTAHHGETIGHVFDIKRDASDDGPGIRTTVFLQGCPMRCDWCQNPEGIPLPKRDRPFSLLQHKPIDTAVSLDTLLVRVLVDRPFFQHSGGGVTLSGGEPTLQLRFAHQLLRALKAKGIHTAIETCGLFPFHAFEAQILPYVDLIYFDLKLFDPHLAKRHTGVSNETILQNFRTLSAQSDVNVIPRIPLVPGITATKENLTALAAFIEATGGQTPELLPYNPTWLDKVRPMKTAPRFTHGQFMTERELSDCAACFLMMDR